MGKSSEEKTTAVSRLSLQSVYWAWLGAIVLLLWTMLTVLALPLPELAFSL